MFEPDKEIGWSQFIVVVPTIANREGVKSPFEITQTTLWCLGKSSFLRLQRSNLNQLDNFSSNAGINVMINNTQGICFFAEEMEKQRSPIIYSSV
jgi:type III restriction enzyme